MRILPVRVNPARVASTAYVNIAAANRRFINGSLNIARSAMGWIVCFEMRAKSHARPCDYLPGML